jgi:mannan endo-1,4-beta-mannosidase
MLQRRRVLQLGSGIVAGSSLISQTTAESTVDSTFEQFVERDGTQLTLDDRAYYFAGTNNFWLTDPGTTREEVTQLLEKAAELDMNAVRTWAFCSGREDGHCLQPTAEYVREGEISEDGGRHLDHVVAEAGRLGIRLIMPLTNYWSAYGGMQQYAEWTDSGENEYLSAYDEFYRSEAVWENYRDFVTTILERENTETGIKYKNDPAILAWELGNEPRARKGEVENRFETLNGWIERASSHFKSVDSNHLVSTGGEGFYDTNMAFYTHQGYEGASFFEDNALDSIDICSMHLYPSSWNLTPQQGTQYIREHIQDARETIGKPVYLGEFGISIDRSADDVFEQLDRRNRIYEEWYDNLDRWDADGALVWQLTLDKRLQYDDGYYVVEDDQETIDIIEQYVKRANAKSNKSAHAAKRRRTARGRQLYDDEAPRPPTDLTVTDVTDTSISLSWTPGEDTAGGTGIAEHELLVESEKGSSITWAGPTASSATLEDLSPDTEYTITARALDNQDYWSSATPELVQRTDA